MRILQKMFNKNYTRKVQVEKDINKLPNNKITIYYDEGYILKEV